MANILTAPSNDLRISLWGPPHSWKKTLINSFVQELKTINQENPDFLYELFERVPGELQPTPLKSAPSFRDPHKSQDFSWMFQRAPLVNDYAHLSSEHTHQICLSYIPGNECLNCFHGPAGNDAAMITITNSQGIILTLNSLDLTSEVRDVIINSDSQQKRRLNQGDYLSWVNQLLKTFTKSNEGKPILSVCVIHQTDSIELEDPWNTLESLFGVQMKNLLQFSQKDFRIGVFSCRINYLPGQQTIDIGHNPDPISYTIQNAAAPFFFIFQEIEQKKKKHGSFFSNFLFRTQHKNSWIPYPNIQSGK